MDCGAGDSDRDLPVQQGAAGARDLVDIGIFRHTVYKTPRLITPSEKNILPELASAFIISI